MRQFPIPLLPAWIRWLLVVAVAGLIFVFSVLVGPAAPPDPGPFWDKQLHFAAYATLAVALAYATARSDIESYRRPLAVVGIAIVYGIAIEFVQAPLPDRFFSVADMAANAVGALLGLAYLVVEQRMQYAPVGERDDSGVSSRNP